VCPSRPDLRYGAGTVSAGDARRAVLEAAMLFVDRRIRRGYLHYAAARAGVLQHLCIGFEIGEVGGTDGARLRRLMNVRLDALVAGSKFHVPVTVAEKLDSSLSLACPMHHFIRKVSSRRGS